MPLYQTYKNTQVFLIRCPDVLRRVLDQPEVKQTELFRKFLKKQGSSNDAILENFDRILVVESKADTEVIEIQIHMPNPQDAATISNAILDQYIGFVNESSQQGGDLVYKKLIEEERSRSNEIEGRQKLVDRLRKELGTGAPDELVSKKRVRCDGMEAELSRLRKDIQLAEWQRNSLAALLTQTPQTSATQPRVRTLHDSDTEGLRRHDMPFEPTDREREVTTAQDLRHLHKRLEQLKYEEQLLQEELKKERESLERVFDGATVLTKETEAIERLKKLCNAVRTRLDEQMVERNSPSSVQVLARAVVPLWPTQDPRPGLTVVALVAALSVGVLVAFLRSRRG
jgi:capsular polysaccharide biosynthesis protein